MSHGAGYVGQVALSSGLEASPFEAVAFEARLRPAPMRGRAYWAISPGAAVWRNCRKRRRRDYLKLTNWRATPKSSPFTREITT
jgi:hypothetical protein